MTDIREKLPVAVKTGPASKPVWEIGNGKFKFVQPVKADGTDPKGRKVRLGKRKLARYKAGTTKSGEDLVFVGVFANAE